MVIGRCLKGRGERLLPKEALDMRGVVTVILEVHYYRNGTGGRVLLRQGKFEERVATENG